MDFDVHYCLSFGKRRALNTVYHDLVLVGV